MLCTGMILLVLTFISTLQQSDRKFCQPTKKQFFQWGKERKNLGDFMTEKLRRKICIKVSNTWQHREGIQHSTRKKCPCWGSQRRASPAKPSFFVGFSTTAVLSVLMQARRRKSFFDESMMLHRTMFRTLTASLSSLRHSINGRPTRLAKDQL